jgi:hypothetical protein
VTRQRDHTPLVLPALLCAAAVIQWFVIGWAIRSTADIESGAWWLMFFGSYVVRPAVATLLVIGAVWISVKR